MTSDHAIDGIDPAVPPSGAGCLECDAGGGWWFHLRRCAQCGHIGCCDSSPSQHATAHFRDTGHPLVRSFEPGEGWYWNYATNELYESGPELAARLLAQPQDPLRLRPVLRRVVRPGPRGDGAGGP
ncbi:UBP-type zinc finger domain-containing protein, partial [Streptomyces sp. NPDC003011]